MKLTDAFSKVIKNFGIKNVFGLQGGAVVHFFDSLEKHKINPHVSNFRHRFFWDGGIHCNTLDIRRRGKKERYLN